VAFAEGDYEKMVMENCTLKEKKRFAKLLFFRSALGCTRHDAQITRHESRVTNHASQITTHNLPKKLKMVLP
jgi:hypothetical protein